MTDRTEMLFVQKDHLIFCCLKGEELEFIAVAGAKQKAGTQMRNVCACKCFFLFSVCLWDPSGVLLSISVPFWRTWL